MEKAQNWHDASDDHGRKNENSLNLLKLTLGMGKESDWGYSLQSVCLWLIN